MNLRHGIFAGVSLLTFFISLFLMVIFFEGKDIRATTENAAKILSSSKYNLNQYFENNKEMLEEASNSHAIKEVIINGNPTSETKIMINSGIKKPKIWVIDTNKNVLVGGQKLPDPVNSNLFPYHARNNEQIIYIDDHGNDFVLYSTPVTVNSQEVGYVIMQERFKDVAQKITSSSYFDVEIFTDNLHRKIRHKEIIIRGETLLHSNKNMVLDIDYEDNVKKYAIHQKYPNSLDVKFVTTSNVMKTDLSEAITYSLFISLVLGVSVTIVVVVIISYRLSKLKRLSKKITENDLSFRIDNISNDEIGDLEEHFEHMRKSLYKSKDENRKLAFFDELTDLANRRSMIKSLEISISESNEENKNLSVLVLDVDDMKDVNDAHGHHIGDKLIIMMAKRLDMVVQEFIIENSQDNLSYIISRIESDEFAIIISGHDNEQIISRLANHINKSFTKSFYVEAAKFTHTVSIGMVSYPEHGKNINEILKNADTAMYCSKKRRKGNNKWFDKSLAEQAKKRKDMIEMIRNAISQDLFTVYYQPKVNPESSEFVEMEALIRWKTREGFIAPSEFIPVAEDSGLIDEIGECVILKVLSDIRSLYANGYEDFKISFNVSPKQLRSRRFTNWLIKSIIEYGVMPKNLEMEITESSIAEDMSKVMNIISELKMFGISISIDDFGTGYSSLAYLHNLPIDTIKIDRSFVSNCDRDVKKQAIIDTITALAKGLGIKLVAEGAERVEEVSFAKSKGCQLIQGFYFHKPMPISEILNKISK